MGMGSLYVVNIDIYQCAIEAIKVMQDPKVKMFLQEELKKNAQ